MIESPLDFLRFLFDAFQPVIENHLILKSNFVSCGAFARGFPLDGFLCLLIRGEADQSVTSTDVEIDIGQMAQYRRTCRPGKQA